MTTSYLPYAPEQTLMLPPALQDWLPEGHLAYFISDTVDALDLSAFHNRYSSGGQGKQPFHPAMMVKILLYGYATGVFSSRKLAKKLHEDVAFRVLAADNFPAHRTLCDFRAFNLEALAELFVQVVKLAQECGLVSLGTIAIDGTKMKANASRHKAMSYKRMLEAEVELSAQIQELLSRAQATDEREKNHPDLDIPEEIKRREDRLATIRAAKDRLEARQREADKEKGRHEDDDQKPRGPNGKAKRGPKYKRKFGIPEDRAQESFTDPDSRIMKHSSGAYEQSYNAHTAVDAKNMIIVAAELSQNAAERDRLPALLEAVHSNLQSYPDQTLADAGFRAEAVFEELEKVPTDLIVALGREGRKNIEISKGKYPYTAAMQEKLKTETAEIAYRKRKHIVEPPNGWIKSVLGFRQFSLRGKEKVKCEWKLVTAALNLRRMAYL